MTQAGEVAQPSDSPSRVMLKSSGVPGRLRSTPGVVRLRVRRAVLPAGILLIVVQVVWCAVFLRHEFFARDDIANLDQASRSALSWHYLAQARPGEQPIGSRLTMWALARVSLYGWDLLSAVRIVLAAAIGLAALWLLRTLFGSRPAILIPLVVLLFCPLALPGLGYWTAAAQSLPFALSILLGLTAHVYYVRTGRVRHLVVSAACVLTGLAFSDAGIVLPLMLFAVTSGFLAGRVSWLAGARQAIRTGRAAWLVYVVLIAAYAVVMGVSGSYSWLGSSHLADAFSLRFASDLLRNTFLTAAIGGPWHWVGVSAGSYGLAAPPAGLMILALVVAIGVVGVSVWLNRSAWRAWAILAGWLVVADILPVLLGWRGTTNAVPVPGDVYYLADAVPVLAICIALAFLPVTAESAASPTVASEGPAPSGGRKRVLAPWLHGAAVATVGLFVLGSAWSAGQYLNVTSARPGASYLSNAGEAIRLVSPGTPVIDFRLAADLVGGDLGKGALASTVIGDIQPGKLRWITQPAGTIDGLSMFGPDGRLYQALVAGASSPGLPPGMSCWPVHHTLIVVPFVHPSPRTSRILRIGYLWFDRGPGLVTLLYGGRAYALPVRHGLHAGYLPVSGTVSIVVFTQAPSRGLCVGDAEAGSFAPALGGEIFPPLP
jgi:hypothetical protein